MGFPHSEISGSTFATNSPDLFAGNRVLHRPQAPRHPPCALCSLTYKSSIQPGPRTGRTGASLSPINDRYDFAFGETRDLSSSSLVKVHHSLVRAHARTRMDVRTLEQTCGSFWCNAFALLPAKYRRGPRIIARNLPRRRPIRRPVGRFAASCGAEETRTPDFLLAKEALYQLSYGPRGARSILLLATRGPTERGRQPLRARAHSADTAPRGRPPTQG